MVKKGVEGSGIVLKFKKLSKELSPLRAAQFTMFESFIENSIRTEIMDSVPLIGEFDVKK
jgi:hypothetical protein